MNLKTIVFCAIVASCAVGIAQGRQDDAFPHIEIDLEREIIEIQGRVPIRLDDPEAPKVYLELIACTPNTKEHEVLIVTEALPSHVHAALLMLGLNPGTPATWTQEDGKVIPHAPEGDGVVIELVVTDDAGEERVFTPSDWIVNAQTNEPWPDGQWVFAGSVMRQRGDTEHYAADGAGTLIGLTSFGTEVVAWPGVINPDSQVNEPEWIANVENVPALDTPVTIRIRPAGED